MKKLIYLFAILGLFACNSSNNSNESGSEELMKIRELEKVVYNDKTMTYDKAKGNELIRLYEDFAKFYDKDTLTPGFLFNAAELAMSLKMGVKAVSLFENVYLNYPDYKKAPACIFLEAFVFETLLFDNNKAKEKYTLFLEKYPTHELADDAQASINNLGKSLEDLVRSFEESDSLAKK
ncbi:MAG TPA: hypothetical protein DDX39_12360 [Bacteroidales bacterium]|nr:MAG: hypothetical protein A2W98_11770 [Bacteroidetes bacterium GWF2_33_38]OFY76376.1 MAG: hypothetical protein A2265_02055 [Bacteroidetes bacterium RIFOXYA12_FULL_33_9]OFY88455.1 MAG: hypothetical protein A2236_03555 [Bacteroidetes bacterium RIFOXYA2_FULL_33_7]HBF89426.1 hypothetical protein [Bacteroidales bacterium]